MSGVCLDIILFVNKKDQSQGKHPREETMNSFGECHATRSDEEGFGGVHGENHELSKNDEEKIVHAKSLNVILTKEVK